MVAEFFPIIFPELYQTPQNRQHAKPRRSPLSALISDLKRKMEEESFDLSDAEDYYDACFDHAASVDASGSRFLQLPPELLTLIMEHCLTLPWNAVESHSTRVKFITKLRLIHPRLAYLRFLKQELFKTLYVTSSPERLDVLDRDLSEVAPWVRRVVFRPTIVFRYAFPENRKYDSVKKVREMMGPRAAKVLENGRLEAIWTRVLRSVPRVANIRIENAPDSGWQLIVCGPPLHVLLSAMIKSLATSKCRPQELIFDHCADDEFIWTKNDDWENLDLSRLKKMDVNFRIEDLSRKWDYKKTYRLESAMVVSKLLHRSAENLRQLQLSNNALSCISSDPTAPTPPSMLAMTSLKLRDGWVDADRVSIWLRGCLKLVDFQTYAINLDPAANIERWRTVFTAIREHPNNIRVHMERVYPYGDLLFSLMLSHDRPVTLYSHYFPSKLISELRAMIMNYISGESEWDLQERWNPANYHEPEDESDTDVDPDFDPDVIDWPPPDIDLDELDGIAAHIPSYEMYDW